MLSHKPSPSHHPPIQPTFPPAAMAELIAEIPIETENVALEQDVDSKDAQDAQDAPLATEDNALVTTNAEGKKVVRKIIKKKKRPARPQVDPATFKSEPPPQTGVYIAARRSNNIKAKTHGRNNLQYLVQQVVWWRSRRQIPLQDKGALAMQHCQGYWIYTSR